MPRSKKVVVETMEVVPVVPKPLPLPKPKAKTTKPRPKELAPVHVVTPQVTPETPLVLVKAKRPASEYAMFVSKHFSTVEGTPSARMSKISQMWKLRK